MKNTMTANIITVVFVFVLLSGIFLVYDYMLDDNREDGLKTEAEALSSEIDEAIFHRNPHIISNIAGLSVVKDSLSEGLDINYELELLQESLGAEIIYVLNLEGEVIASSSYGEDEEFSLLGNNYEFRPYFQEAITNLNSLYAAVGATTGVRGLYFSNAVYDEEVLGVVVIKVPLDEVDEILQSTDLHASILTPEGIIFSSNTDELYGSVYNLNSLALEILEDSKQFPENSIMDLNWEFEGNILLKEGIEYHYIKHPFSIDGWEIIIYEEEDVVSQLLTSQKWILGSLVLVVIILTAVVLLAINAVKVKK